MRRTPAIVAVVGVLAALGLAGCGQPRPQPWSSELVSVNQAGSGSGNYPSDSPSLSGDGTKVAFRSDASDLAAGDANDVADIFVRDLVTGTTTLVSANAAGTGTGNGTSHTPLISADGTKVAFLSQASDLGPADAGADIDLYVRDLVAGTTALASIDATGTDGANDWVVGASFDESGTKIAFETPANNLGPADPGTHSDVYVRDLATNTTSLVSVDLAGADSANDRSGGPQFSADGTKVSFTSLASDLVANPDTAVPSSDVFVRDLVTHTTTLVSVTTYGGAGTGGEAVMSRDGTKVAFESASAELVPGAPGHHVEIYVRDLDAGTTVLASPGLGGASNGQSLDPVLSPDGTKVAFRSWANNLDPRDPNNSVDVYVRDLDAGTTALVSAVDGSDTATDVDGDASSPSFSADGRRISFTSRSNFLGAFDSSRAGAPTFADEHDVYVRDLVARTTTLVSTNATRRDSGDLLSWGGIMAPDGRHVVFESRASDLGPANLNGYHFDVFVATLDPAG